MYLDDGKLCGEFWIVGDEAYKCSESLITPVLRSEADEDENAFNFFLSQLRIHIEQVFGKMVAKWSIFESLLGYSIAKCSKIITAAMCLHNWCIDHREPFKRGLDPDMWPDVYKDTIRWHREVRKEIVSEALNGNLRSERAITNHSRKLSKKRNMLIDVVRGKGLRRPFSRE